MATPHLLLPPLLLLLPLCLSFFLTSALDVPPFLVPLSKHPAALQYLATAYFDLCPRPVKLVLDLGSPFASIRCSSRGLARQVPCRSIPCISARVNIGGGSDNSNVFCWDGGSACGVRGAGELVAGDAVFGSPSGFRMSNFLYGCAADPVMSGMVSGVGGALGLGGSSRISLPFQVSASFGTPTRFSLCLSSSRGILIIGGRSNSPSYTALSKSLTYAPLVTASSGDSPHDHRIDLSSINVDGVPLSPNSTSPPYLARLSTTIPYTTMTAPLYEAFSAACLDAATSAGMKLARAVPPFGSCFEQNGEGRADRTPGIDLVMQSTMVKWTIRGRNLMVRDDGVVCLGIVDGGVGREEEVVLGGHQLEDVLVEFDFGRSVLGFSPSLASMGTSCKELASDLASN